MNCEAVGHSGDIIGDRPRRLAVPCLGRPVARHCGRISQVGLEEAPYDRVRLVAHPLHRLVAVHVGEKERLDVAVGRSEGSRMADKGSARRRDRRQAVDFGFGDPASALADRVLDETGDDAPRQLVDHARLLEPGMEVLDFAEKPVDERNSRADFAHREQPGAQTVVDVVRVVGDVVGDRGCLRLEARVKA